MVAALLLPALVASSASAAFKKIYVNSNGTDSATCGALTAPCKTLQGGIDSADANDDVFLQGPADFKPAVVNKSISIFGSGVYSTDLEPCLTINGGPEIAVTIFDFECRQANPGYDGIAFTGGRNLRIVNSTIRGGSCGIRFRPSSQRARFETSRVAVRGSESGICLESAGANQEIIAVNSDTLLVGNRYGLASDAAAAAAANTVRAYNYRVDFSGGGTGVYSTGARSTVRLLDCTVVNNSFLGLEHPNGGLIIDQGKNIVKDNNTDGTFTSVDLF